MWNRLFGGAGWKDEAVSAGILWNAAAVDDCYEIGSLCLDWVTVFHYFATFLIRQIRGRTVLAARGKTVMICPGRRVRAARGAAAGGPVTRTHSRPLMLHSLRCLSWLFKVSRVVLLSCVMALSLNLNTAHTTIKQTSKCLTELIIWKLRYNILSWSVSSVSVSTWGGESSDGETVDWPGDLVVGELELGEEDGAVLGPPAVYHRDDLVPPPHRPHQPQVLYRALHTLKCRFGISFCVEFYLRAIKFYFYFGRMLRIALGCFW